MPSSELQRQELGNCSSPRLHAAQWGVEDRGCKGSMYGLLILVCNLSLGPYARGHARPQRAPAHVHADVGPERRVSRDRPFSGRPRRRPCGWRCLGLWPLGRWALLPVRQPVGKTALLASIRYNLIRFQHGKCVFKKSSPPCNICHVNILLVMFAGSLIVPQRKGESNPPLAVSTERAKLRGYLNSFCCRM